VPNSVAAAPNKAESRLEWKLARHFAKAGKKRRKKGE